MWQISSHSRCGFPQTWSDLTCKRVFLLWQGLWKIITPILHQHRAMPTAQLMKHPMMQSLNALPVNGCHEAPSLYVICYHWQLQNDYMMYTYGKALWHMPKCLLWCMSWFMSQQDALCEHVCFSILYLICHFQYFVRELSRQQKISNRDFGETVKSTLPHLVGVGRFCSIPSLTLRWKIINMSNAGARETKRHRDVHVYYVDSCAYVAHKY